MFGRSIKQRFLLWLGFLLLAVLSGFGFTAYQMYRSSELNRIDAELERRVGALMIDVRGGPRRGGGPPPGLRGPPPDGEFRGPEGQGVPDRFRMREFRLSERTQGLFDESETNAFYFTIWAPGG